MLGLAWVAACSLDAATLHRGAAMTTWGCPVEPAKSGSIISRIVLIVRRGRVGRLGRRCGGCLGGAFGTLGSSGGALGGGGCTFCRH